MAFRLGNGQITYVGWVVTKVTRMARGLPFGTVLAEEWREAFRGCQEGASGSGGRTQPMADHAGVLALGAIAAPTLAADKFMCVARGSPTSFADCNCRFMTGITRRRLRACDRHLAPAFR